MKISLSWLKNYIDLEQTPEEICDILTQIGLEAAGTEIFETVKGGMKGLVIGQVVTCEKHPNSDHLSKTTVDIGNGTVLPIVCGAPNVAAGQKVVVATVGSTLYMGDESLTIKKAKIRGEVSEGMICAEDEIGVGNDHNGIIVLPEKAIVGTRAAEYFNIESDTVIEIDLTPNRIDSASHIGVARDLAAFLSKTKSIACHRPPVDQFAVDNHNLEIPVEIKNPEACHRYAGVTITGVSVKPSPDWLQNRLKSIGLTPINNIVDITNFVLFETGQPLHAFDADEVKGGKVVVKLSDEGTKFVTLDEVERELHAEDLMICNTVEGMCIGGVFGGIASGVKATTTKLFLESAWFDPVFIRKTARRHGLYTDASFRFERGTDPNGVIYALKRAALLIKELAGGTISSEIVDIYPEPVKGFEVDISYANVTRLIGKDLGKDVIKNILKSLEIEISGESEEGLSLLVPPYRVDVKREVDVIEEILRIYGYNRIEITGHINASLQTSEKPDKNKVKNHVSEMLSAYGYNEIWSNSLTKNAYYESLESYPEDKTVKVLNPLSTDLNSMRQSLLFGGLESISYNINRQNSNLRFYEFGNCYFFDNTKTTNGSAANKYHEEHHLALWVTGDKQEGNWSEKKQPTTYFTLKGHVENVLAKLGIAASQLRISPGSNTIYASGVDYTYNNQLVATCGIVSKKWLRYFEIDNAVYFADLQWDAIFKQYKKHRVTFNELPKFPSVRRDLALLLDKSVAFTQLRDLAYKTERQLLTNVDLFDVYEGKGIPENKKSYALSFVLRDDNKTLNDKRIDKTMQRLIAAFKREFDAEIR